MDGPEAQESSNVARLVLVHQLVCESATLYHVRHRGCILSQKS